LLLLRKIVSAPPHTPPPLRPETIFLALLKGCSDDGEKLIRVEASAADQGASTSGWWSREAACIIFSDE
jgi:hypothetical protein